MSEETKNQKELRQTPFSEIEKALSLIEDYEQVREIWFNPSNSDSSPYTVFTQVERAYEQLQSLGVDVSDKLKQTRTIITRSLYDMIYAELTSAGFHLLPKEGSIEKNLGLSFPYLKRAVTLLEEYVKKVDPSNDSLNGSLMDLEITSG